MDGPRVRCSDGPARWSSPHRKDPHMTRAMRPSRKVRSLNRQYATIQDNIHRMRAMKDCPSCGGINSHKCKAGCSNGRVSR